MTSDLRKSIEQFGSPTRQSGISVAYYDQLESIRQVWDEVAPPDNLFLRSNYLSVLESAPPLGMKLAYLLFFNKQRIVGVALCQVQYFKADKSIKLEENNGTPCFFSTFARYLRGLVASKVEFNTLVCGNLLLTGSHGFYFDSKMIDEKKSLSLLTEGLEYAQQLLNDSGTMISATLIKDFYQQQRDTSNAPLLKEGYNEFTIQPNMVMSLDPNWETFEDYLNSLSSKYRVRAKRAFKKCVPLIRRELDMEAIEASLPRIYELYKEIAQNSGFNVVNLNQHYLLALKKHLPDRFRLFGYYDGDKLVAYFTTILNGKELEAHFLGFERDANAKYQIYMNILFDMLSIGIEKRVARIIYARTALEIKSSVGAVAKEMYCYMRHRNNFSNRFMMPLLEYLKPETSFEPRHPFK